MVRRGDGHRPQRLARETDISRYKVNGISVPRSNYTKEAQTKGRQWIKLISSTFGIWNFNQIEAEHLLNLALQVPDLTHQNLLYI